MIAATIIRRQENFQKFGRQYAISPDFFGFCNRKGQQIVLNLASFWHFACFEILFLRRIIVSTTVCVCGLEELNAAYLYQCVCVYVCVTGPYGRASQAVVIPCLQEEYALAR